MEDERIDVIIIRGAPGSGKSQTAKSLSKFYSKGVRLEVDAVRQMVVSVDWKNQQEHINMLQVSAGMVYDFLKFGFNPVIVVDTFSGEKISRYLDTLYQLDEKLSIKIFGLFTTDDELKKRLEMRSIEEFRDYAICRKLNRDVLKIKYEGEYQINTTGLTPSQSAKSIVEQLSRKGVDAPV